MILLLVLVGGSGIGVVDPARTITPTSRTVTIPFIVLLLVLVMSLLVVSFRNDILMVLLFQPVAG
jgi:hypothetical protein